MSDPRERVETQHIRCDNRTDTAWCLGAVGSNVAAWATWPEVVAFAQAILAADAEWRLQQVPSLETLMANNPGRYMRLAIDRGLFRATLDGVESPWLKGRVEALEWLAAELAKQEAGR